MGGIVTLNEAMEHVRVDDQNEGHAISAMIQAAEDYVMRYLGRTLPFTEIVEYEDGTIEEEEIDPPASVRHAVLLVITDLYDVRGATVDYRIRDNPTASRLLDFHRVGIGV